MRPSSGQTKTKRSLRQGSQRSSRMVKRAAASALTPSVDAQVAATGNVSKDVTDDVTGGLTCMRPLALTAAQLEPLAKMIARQLAQEEDGVGWHGPIERLTAGER